jgi:glyoxylase-like metal-dependent hydrolase (beta-lactamase superfamily II)
MLTRRLALCIAVAGLVASCAAMGTTSNTLRATELAPGVYLLPGSGGAADEKNLGRIGNAGFIVGDDSVIAIDTGTSLAHGRDLLAAIRAVTDKPVKVALVTHTRPEFLFGGAAFREQGIPIRMHHNTATLMTSRCETCLKTLHQTVGEAPLAGTVMYRSDQTFEATHVLELGGRTVKVLYFGHSSGPGDIAVLDTASGVLFAGGLLDARRVPDIQDSDLEGWKRALQSLRELPLVMIVPGHGPASPPALIGSVEDYIVQLESRMRALVKQGVSLLNVPDAGELPAFAGWDQYDTIHRRNASVAFLRFERELLFK